MEIICKDNEVVFETILKGIRRKNPKSADAFKEFAWIHNTDMISPEKFEELSRCTQIVLSGQAVKLIEKLGLDSLSSLVNEKIVKREDPWDKRGFQSYKGHPLFNELHGGFYSILIDLPTSNLSEIYLYKGKKAKIVAVEKGYISVFRDKPIIWEYVHGDRKILCIGGYLEFVNHEKNPYRAEVEKFIENICKYLIFDQRDNASYWPAISKGVEFFENLKLDPISLEPLAQPKHSLKLINTGSKYVNTSGRRILVNALCNGKINEVWLHPFRLLKEMEFEIDGVKLTEKNVITTVSPEGISFESDFGSLQIFASLNNPWMLGQLNFLDDTVHEIMVSFSTDLRIMWPLDKSFNGKRYFNYDSKSKAVVFSTEDEMLKGYITFDKLSQISLRKSQSLIYGTVTIKAARLLNFVVGGSVNGEELPEKISLQNENEFANAFYINYLASTSKVTTDIPVLDESVKWAKVQTIKFLSKTPGIGTGLMAGYANSLPGWFEARPGYAWYFGRDSEWVSFALLDYGDFDTVKENLKLLLKFQRIDGKIFHELTTSGMVHYDAADATPLLLLLIHRYVSHSGDFDFLKENWIKIKRAYEYCLSTDSDGDGLIENTVAGHGWVEGGKLYGAHASFYLNVIWHSALEGMVKLSGKMEDKETAESAKKALNKLRDSLEKFWDPQNEKYCLGLNDRGERMDFYTVMTAVGSFLAKPYLRDTTRQIIEYATSDFSTDWGTRIIGKSSGIFNPNGYHEGTVWPLFTGWVSNAEYRLGATQSAFNHMTANLFDFLHHSRGYVSEVLNGEVYSPSGICKHQAWSESMGLQPLFEGLLGLEVTEPGLKISFSPQIPMNLKRISFSNLKIRKSVFDFEYRREEHIDKKVKVKQHYTLLANRKATVDFSPWIPKNAENVSVKLNGISCPFDIVEGITSKKLVLRNSVKFEEKSTIVVSYEVSFEIGAILANPIPGTPSSQPRIVSLDKGNREWILSVEVFGDIDSKIPALLSKSVKIEGITCKDEEGNLIFSKNGKDSYEKRKVFFREVEYGH